jgi:hypothetical protein
MNGLRVLGVDVKSVKVSRTITHLRFIEHEKTKQQWHQLMKDYLHTNFHACGASGFGETLLTLTLFSDFQLFSGLSTTDETLVVEMRIWCIKIGNVFALHYKDFSKKVE